MLITLALLSIFTGSVAAATLGTGFPPSRAVIDQAGNFWINGASFYDTNGNDLATVFKNIQGTTNVDGLNVVHEYRGTWDFSVQGGTAGTINLGVVNGAASAATLPANAIIFDGLYDVVTPCTAAGGGTFALGVEAAGDLQATVGMATSCTTGRHAISPTSAASSVETTAARTPNIVIATQNATAGKIVLFLRYFISG